ncbi:MAG: septum formation inhibitor Maf [Porticoccaceae bacterium]|jgi:septum formation protein|nr:septum formation inhibitor Maf [Porticoccaceae bacterium]
MILLASASPRRAEILERHGVEFFVSPADIDESVNPLENAPDYVLRLAKEKAESQRPELPSSGCELILAADTCVEIENQILGKPSNFEDFLSILEKLSGRTHQVHSGVALAKEGVKTELVLVSTRVHFRELSEREIRSYWESGEPQDKAGGYGIQGLAAEFVTGIEGSFSNVVGLPIRETMQLLNRWGVASTLDPRAR